MVGFKKRTLGIDAALTFSLISSNQLRTVGNTNTFISIVIAKRQLYLSRKRSRPTQPLVALNPDRRRRKDADDGG